MENHNHASHKQVINRLARIEGHVSAVKRMVAEGRDCPEVLVQIAAIRKAIDNTAKLILKDHLEHCLVHAVNEGETKNFYKDSKKPLTGTSGEEGNYEGATAYRSLVSYSIRRLCSFRRSS